MKGGFAMFTVNNFFNNDDITILDQKGPFRVLEYRRDLSVSPANAMMAYYCNEMNVRKRQVAVDVGMSNVTVQAGAMQWTVGNVNATTGIKGVGDLFGKALRGSVTGESAIKPEYTGDGLLVLEYDVSGRTADLIHRNLIARNSGHLGTAQNVVVV